MQDQSNFYRSSRQLTKELMHMDKKKQASDFLVLITILTIFLFYITRNREGWVYCSSIFLHQFSVILLEKIISNCCPQLHASYVTVGTRFDTT